MLLVTRRAVAVVDEVGTVVPHDMGEIRLPPYGVMSTFEFLISGEASYGGVEPVLGADVVARTVLESAEEVVFEASATSDADGRAVVQLIPDRDYQLSVVPPPEAPHAIVFDYPVTAGLYGVPAPIELPRRASVTGSVVAADQLPVPGLEVQARLSFPYLMSLSPEQRVRVEGLVWKAVEVEDGFVLYLDETIFDGDTSLPLPSYDLEVLPPEGGWLPPWSFDNYVDFNRESDVPVMGSLAKEPRQLPMASIVRAFVTDEHGEPAGEAHLEVFALADTAICVTLNVAGNDCRPKPRRLALGVSDEDGNIRGLVLPNPDAP